MDNNYTNNQCNINDNNTPNTTSTTNIDQTNTDNKRSHPFYNRFHITHSNTPSNFLFLSSLFLFQDIDVLNSLYQNSNVDKIKFIYLLKNYLDLFFDLLELISYRDDLVANHFSDYIEILSRDKISYNRILSIKGSSDNNQTGISNDPKSTNSFNRLMDEYNILRRLSN